MAVTPVNASKTVTTAGTRVQVNSTAGILPTSIYFEALGSNTGYIYVGLSDVASTLYIARLSAGQGFSLGAEIGSLGYRAGGQGLKLSDYWVDSSVNGEKVLVTYMYSTGG